MLLHEDERNYVLRGQMYKKVVQLTMYIRQPVKVVAALGRST